jgi:thioesterase DpgC
MPVPPGLTGDFEPDAASLAGALASARRLIDGFPAKPDRDAAQQAQVMRVLERSRKLRDRFINLHAVAVYDELTAGQTRYLRLAELAYAAADRFPGLVPTHEQIDRERGQRQADKDGSEIDQGIFFRGLLRSPRVGEHLVQAMLLASPRARLLYPEFQRTGRHDLGCVVIEHNAGVARLTVNNQHCLNAEDDRLIDDMETAVDLVLLDDRVRVAVLRGGVMSHPRYRGRRVFSAGINLHDLRDGKISFVNFLLRREFGYISKIARGLLTDPGTDRYPHSTAQKPWIAAVDSFAIGGGMQLLMAFDWVLAADDAFFSLPAAHEGIIPGAANLRLSRQAGPRLARRVILNGDLIRASDAAAKVLCDEVVPAAEMDDALDRAIRDLSQPAVTANRRMISLAEETTDAFREYMAEFAFLQATRMCSDDVIAKLSRRAAGEKAAETAEHAADRSA